MGIVGLGYVGLSSAACFGRKFRVVALDSAREKVASLRDGNVPFREKELPGLLRKGLAAGRLTFTTDYSELQAANFVFITVGTPSLHSGEMDLTQVRSSVRSLAGVVSKSDGYLIVVVKSTVLPGTARNVVKRDIERYSRKVAGKDFGLCSNPEFLREGSAVQDTLHPDRIVIGAETERDASALAGLYRRFYGNGSPEVVQTSLEGAELIKYACNSYLATKISFINLIARICERLPSVDVGEVTRAMGLDPRIGGSYLEAGPGFGGSCFPKDVKALMAYSKVLGLDASLLRAVDAINNGQPGHVLSLPERKLGGLKGKTVAVLGLAFKEGTDDIRESRGVKLVEVLIRKGAKPRVYDPLAMENARAVLGPAVSYASSAIECLTGADLGIVMTRDEEFRRLAPLDFIKQMKSPVILDARRIYEPAKFERALGFQAVGHGWRRG